MGNSNSRTYKQAGLGTQTDVTINVDNTPISKRAFSDAMEFESYNGDKAREARMGKQLDIMEANLKMYMLYDNYQIKNEVIIKDLKKKANNQDEELKVLIEKRDKLKVEYDEKVDEQYYTTLEEKNMKIANIVLFIILVALLVFMIYKIYTYKDPDSNNVDINNLIGLSNDNFSNLSLNELNKLEDVFDSKINEMESNLALNNSNAGNKLTLNNVSNWSNNNSAKNNVSKNNVSKNNAGNNSATNINSNNLNKKNKLTL